MIGSIPVLTVELPSQFLPSNSDAGANYLAQELVVSEVEMQWRLIFDLYEPFALYLILCTLVFSSSPSFSYYQFFVLDYSATQSPLAWIKRNAVFLLQNCIALDEDCETKINCVDLWYAIFLDHYLHALKLQYLVAELLFNMLNIREVVFS